MTFATYPAAQAEPPLDPRQSLPTMYDLPSEDPKEPGLPDTFHLDLRQLLEFTFLPAGCDAEQVFTASEITLYNVETVAIESIKLKHLQVQEVPLLQV